MNTKTFFLLLFFIFPSLLSAESVKDSLSFQDKTTQFRPQELIVPASLVAIGTWGICNNWLQSLNHDIRNELLEARGECTFRADDYLQYLPVASNLGLAYLGAKAKHPFDERLIATATAYLTMGIIVNSIKLSVDVKRPNSSANNSFPSGHTATAFMGAELVRLEYGGIYGIGAYTIASSVAFLRLYNDRHWFNDVLTGAGIGILSARIGYWLLPYTRNIFKTKGNAPIEIAGSPLVSSYGLGYSLSFQF